MNKKEFYAFLNQPGMLNKQNKEQLKSLLDEFPYCQTARILYVKSLHNEKSLQYHRQLKKAAVYVTDRKELYRLLMQEGLQEKIRETEAEPESSAPNEETGIIKGEAKQATPTFDGSKTEEKERYPDVKATAAKKTSSDISPLEHEILKEAISASIALEIKAPKNQEEETSEHKQQKETENTKDKKTETEAPERIHETTGKKSFNNWLKQYSKPDKSGGEQEDVNKKPEKSNMELIERFIHEEPKIERKKVEFFSPENLGRMSLVEDESFVTETLAKIYAEQGYFEKAISAFENLSLKYPEKSSYFASQIQILKEKLNNK